MSDRLTNPISYTVPTLSQTDRNSAAYGANPKNRVTNKIYKAKFLGAGAKSESPEHEMTALVVKEAPMIKYLASAIANSSLDDKILDIAMNDSDNPSGYSDPSRYSGPDLAEEKTFLPDEVRDVILEQHHQLGAGLGDFLGSVFGSLKSGISKLPGMLSNAVRRAPAFLANAHETASAINDISSGNYRGRKGYYDQMNSPQYQQLGNYDYSQPQYSAAPEYDYQQQPREDYPYQPEYDNQLPAYNSYEDEMARGRFDEDEASRKYAELEAAKAPLRRSGRNVGKKVKYGRGLRDDEAVAELLAESGSLLGGAFGKITRRRSRRGGSEQSLVPVIEEVYNSLVGSGIHPDVVKDVVTHAINIAPLISNGVPFSIALPHSIVSQAVHGGTILGEDMSKLDLDALHDILSDTVSDVSGGGFFDDIFSGIKSVADFALPILKIGSMFAGKLSNHRRNSHRIGRRRHLLRPRHGGEIESENLSKGGLLNPSFQREVVNAVNLYISKSQKNNSSSRNVVLSELKKKLTNELKDFGLKMISNGQYDRSLTAKYKLQLKEFLRKFGLSLTLIKNHKLESSVNEYVSEIMQSLHDLHFLQRGSGVSSQFQPVSQYITTPVEGLPMYYGKKTDRIMGPQNPWS
jgi:hypothetical protein